MSYASRDPVVFERSHHVSVDAVDYRLTASASKILSPCVVGRRRGSVVQFHAMLVDLISGVRIASSDGRQPLVASRCRPQWLTRRRRDPPLIAVGVYLRP